MNIHRLQLLTYLFSNVFCTGVNRWPAGGKSELHSVVFPRADMCERIVTIPTIQIEIVMMTFFLFFFFSFRGILVIRKLKLKLKLNCENTWKLVKLIYWKFSQKKKKKRGGKTTAEIDICQGPIPLSVIRGQQVKIEYSSSIIEVLPWPNNNHIIPQQEKIRKQEQKNKRT